MITEVEPLLTTLKDVNNNRIELTEQTKATVKTKNEPLEFPLLVTKATTSPLTGLDWMQRLGLHLNNKTVDHKYTTSNCTIPKRK